MHLLKLLLTHAERSRREQAALMRRRMKYGTLVETLAQEYGYSPDEVEALLDAGPTEAQARRMLEAGKEFHVYPAAIWELHKSIARAR